MIKNYKTEAKSSLTLKNSNEEFIVNLYSQEGFEMLSNLWIKVSTEFKMMYELKWLGRPIIQFGSDMVMLQQLIWDVKPDIFIETGIAHGGSLIYTASLFEMMGNDGQVIGIDVEIRPHNRSAIQEHTLYKRIKMIEGSSVGEETILALEKLIEGSSGKTITVMLDSNHSKDHVLKELELYSKYVTVGSYMIVQDGAQQWVADIPRGKAEWIDDNPLAAIEEFLKTNSDFIIDESFTRLGITSSPGGYLKRVK
jgi:cephalosporin hydroxylase